MDKFLSYYRKIEKKFNSLMVRERFLFLGFFLVIFAIYFESNIVEPSLVALKDKQLIFDSIQKEINIVNDTVVQMKSDTSDNNPISNLEKQLNNTKSENEQILKTLKEQSNKIVSAEEMSKVLKIILKQNPGITVTGIENINEIPIFANIDKSDSGVYQIYEHGLKLKLSGNFESVFKFISALEGLNWWVAWKEITYKVKEFPIAEVEIILSTLSMDSGWIKRVGVK
jgi:MSHA biogenesis protein MshJ